MGKIKIPKCYIIITFLVVLIPIFLLLYQSGAIEILYRSITDSDFGYRWNSDLDNRKEFYSTLDILIDIMKNTLSDANYNIIFGTNMFSIFITLLAGVAGIRYYEYHNTLLNYGALYQNNYRKYVLKNIVNESLKCALSIFVGFLIYYLLVLWSSSFKIVPMQAGRTLFCDIWPQFYFNYPILYYFSVGVVTFFIIPFIYAMLGCSCALIFSNKKIVYLMPTFYYYLMTIIGYAAYNFTYYGLYLNASVIMCTGSYIYINTYGILGFSSIPLWIALLIIYRKTKYVEI